MSPSTRAKLLLVDDQVENLIALEAVLEPLGQELVRAHSGKEALTHLLRDEFALILMDVQMPEMDGPTAAQAIRRREVETGRSRTPILALTANAMSHQEAEYLACGMDAIIAKPIQVDRLFAALQEALEGQAKVRAA